MYGMIRFSLILFLILLGIILIVSLKVGDSINFYHT